MASGTAQNELALKARCCESLAFHKRSAARKGTNRRARETAVGARTLIKTTLPLGCERNNCRRRFKGSREQEISKQHDKAGLFSWDRYYVWSQTGTIISIKPKIDQK